MKVSVIVPVYNVQEYICDLIESLKAQTLKEIEYIFIDDCSTDASMEKVKDWAFRDSRVIIVRNTENIGPGPSRNNGIAIARGEYLAFADPDGYYDDAYNKRIEYLTNELSRLPDDRRNRVVNELFSKHHIRLDFLFS